MRDGYTERSGAGPDRRIRIQSAGLTVRWAHILQGVAGRCGEPATATAVAMCISRTPGRSARTQRNQYDDSFLLGRGCLKTRVDQRRAGVAPPPRPWMMPVGSAGGGQWVLSRRIVRDNRTFDGNNYQSLPDSRRRGIIRSHSLCETTPGVVLRSESNRDQPRRPAIRLPSRRSPLPQRVAQSV